MHENKMLIKYDTKLKQWWLINERISLYEFIGYQSRIFTFQQHKSQNNSKEKYQTLMFIYSIPKTSNDQDKIYCKKMAYKFIADQWFFQVILTINSQCHKFLRPKDNKYLEFSVTLKAN